jgi:hypothetical protein
MVRFFFSTSEERQQTTVHQSNVLINFNQKIKYHLTFEKKAGETERKKINNPNILQQLTIPEQFLAQY